MIRSSQAAIFSHLRQLEIDLHQYETRTDIKQLQKLLHPAFIEIGYSGRRYNFITVAAGLIAEEPPTHTLWSQNYEFIEHTASNIQLLYQSANMNAHDKLSRHALRTSIWVKSAANWQMIYHQGTPTGPFAQEQDHANL